MSSPGNRRRLGSLRALLIFFLGVIFWLYMLVWYNTNLHLNNLLPQRRRHINLWARFIKNKWKNKHHWFGPITVCLSWAKLMCLRSETSAIEMVFKHILTTVYQETTQDFTDALAGYFPINCYNLGWISSGISSRAHKGYSKFSNNTSCKKTMRKSHL